MIYLASEENLRHVAGKLDQITISIVFNCIGIPVYLLQPNPFKTRWTMQPMANENKHIKYHTTVQQKMDTNNTNSSRNLPRHVNPCIYLGVARNPVWLWVCDPSLFLPVAISCYQLGNSATPSVVLTPSAPSVHRCRWAKPCGRWDVLGFLQHQCPPQKYLN